uniref:IS91 family transposase n=1 Tax=Arenibacter amylolyticus TaxID=1406873 RepID=UPI001594A18F|nr:transposase [Arenibacter amylolyticus]
MGRIQHNWVIYCKRPFLGPAQVVEYLGRYTHKIAISNHRIKNLDINGVTFTVKDYRNGSRKGLLRLDDAEFIRRFPHILPKGFVRIRHYGILSSSKKSELLPLLQQVLGRPVNHERPPLKHRRCPYCQIGIMVTIAVFDSRGPPKAWSEKLKKFAPSTTHQKA